MKHPECFPDEVFVTNADASTYHKIELETKRKGIVAYERDGSKIGSRWHGCFPVFAKKSEIREKNPGPNF